VERRNSLEIIAQILQISWNGAKKTHIVYKANLNHALLEGYLNRLEKQGLITRLKNSKRIIQTTQKGRQFIEKYMSLQAVAHL